MFTISYKIIILMSPNLQWPVTEDMYELQAPSCIKQSKMFETSDHRLCKHMKFPPKYFIQEGQTRKWKDAQYTLDWDHPCYVFDLYFLYDLYISSFSKQVASAVNGVSSIWSQTSLTLKQLCWCCYYCMLVAGSKPTFSTCLFSHNLIYYSVKFLKIIF